jgi:anthranilate synthase component 1
MTDTTKEEFLHNAATRSVTPVLRRLFVDSETPMGLYRKLGNTLGSFLLESADQAGAWSRYSFLGVSVHGILTEHHGVAQWRDSGMSSDTAFGGTIPQNPLDALRALNDYWLSDPVPGMPPFPGGLVGHIGWDMVRHLESLPHAPESTHEVPPMFLSLVKDFVAIDHQTSEVVLVALVHDHEGAGESDYCEAVARLDALHRILATPTPSTLHRRANIEHVAPVPSIDKETFLGMVAKAKQHITDGDVFQVVLSQAFHEEVSASALEVYRVLRQVNPSPYMYLLECETTSGVPYQVVGSSPEALVTISHGKVVSHPIAGSRPRGQTPGEDAEFAQSLQDDAKEKAEHLMLVDLARNDLSKVAKPGSVEVTQFMQVERFSHIMHLVSTVEGDLRSDASSVDVFEATFPAGTLSGAPKPRALEIIDDLEPAGRGVYGGVVGYFGHSGDADLAITIRTLWMSEGSAIVQAGAGIVADSDPETEYLETLHKASAPARAIRLANALESGNA